LLQHDVEDIRNDAVELLDPSGVCAMIGHHG
jgi:hypothetical protein